MLSSGQSKWYSRCCRQRAHGICRSCARGWRNRQCESADCAVLPLSDLSLSPSYSYFTLAPMNVVATGASLFVARSVSVALCFFLRFREAVIDRRYRRMQKLSVGLCSRSALSHRFTPNLRASLRHRRKALSRIYWGGVGSDTHDRLSTTSRLRIWRAMSKRWQKGRMDLFFEQLVRIAKISSRDVHVDPRSWQNSVRSVDAAL